LDWPGRKEEFAAGKAQGYWHAQPLAPTDPRRQHPLQHVRQLIGSESLVIPTQFYGTERSCSYVTHRDRIIADVQSNGFGGRQIGQ
jgi:hypothetical protein